MAELVKVFAAAYEVVEDPSRPAGERSYDFAAAGISELSPAVEISVAPDAGEAWYGRFFGNYDGPNWIVNGPGSREVSVVSAGTAYVVPVDSPSDYRVLSIWPVRAIHCDPLLGVVLLASFTDVMALGGEGVIRWEAKDLVSDGFTQVLPQGMTLIVTGYVAAEAREVQTTLDMESGVILDRQ